MDYLKKMGYVKGLISGLSIDGSTNEGKVILAMADLLEEIVDEITELQEDFADFEDQLDDLSDDVESLSDAFDDFESLSDDFDCDSGDNIRMFHNHKCDDDCECGCNGDDEDEEYEIDCPGCGHTLIITGDMIDNGGTTCPNCKKQIEFDFQCCCDDCDEDED